MNTLQPVIVMPRQHARAVIAVGGKPLVDRVMSFAAAQQLTRDLRHDTDKPVTLEYRSLGVTARIRSY